MHKKTKILILCICSLFLCCLCACSNFEKDRSTTDLESEIFQEESVVSEKESSNDKVMEQSVNKGTGKRYQSEVYSCRKDEAGKKLDKAAMLVCSKALGHNRISVVADNYIRGL